MMRVMMMMRMMMMLIILLCKRWELCTLVLAVSFEIYNIENAKSINNACATNSTSCEASILKENVKLRAQLELLTSNYRKLEESNENLSSSHEDLLISYDGLKLAQ